MRTQVRDGANMRSVIGHTARHFDRAIIMPNLVPPVTTAAAVGEAQPAPTAQALSGISSSPCTCQTCPDRAQPGAAICHRPWGMLRHMGSTPTKE